MSEATKPYPPRFRWLRRLSVCAVIILVLLILLRLWWGWYADRMLAAQIAALRAAGELMKLTQQQQNWDDGFSSDSRLTDSDLAMIASIMADNQRSLELVSQARQIGQVDWGNTFTRPVADALSAQLSRFSELRHLALLLQWACLYEHARGNDSEAIERLGDILFLADSTEQQLPVLVSNLTAIGIRAYATEQLFRMAPELSIAAPEQIRQTIAQLLDNQSQRRAIARAGQGDRVFVWETMGDALRDNAGLLSSPARPLYTLETVRMADGYGQLAAAYSQRDYPSAMERLPPGKYGQGVSLLERMAHPLALIGYDESRFVALFFRHLTDCQAAAAVLAIRWYSLEHEGKLPPSLDDLVSRYIPALPKDYYRAGAGPLGYLPNATQPAVYSVGDNCVDDGGSTTNKGLVPLGGSSPWHSLDRVYPLKSPLPLTGAPSSDAEDHQ